MVQLGYFVLGVVVGAGFVVWGWRLDRRYLSAAAVNWERRYWSMKDEARKMKC